MTWELSSDEIPFVIWLPSERGRNTDSFHSTIVKCAFGHALDVSFAEASRRIGFVVKGSDVNWSVIVTFPQHYPVVTILCISH
ncbi:hypothetical protein BLJAPNOD_04366 [Ensifer sp. M14]|nr:hypothetical protein BLJAPNOD_04366 [Ensifer sp. M14]